MNNESSQRWIFDPIDKKYQREHFDCGYPVLNNYLKKYARQNHETGIAKTFVALSISHPSQIDGYYTVSASTIEFNSLPPNYQKALPAYPRQFLLISKLAVDLKVQGQGLGGELLVDALLRAVKASTKIDIFAVRVDAIDLLALNFYLKYEFIPFSDQPLSLFLPLKIIKQQFL